MSLLTNHLQFAASTIADIYRDRWQIELFFKALKQNLKIKTFVGTSANAVRIQIWTALIAILLLKILQLKIAPGLGPVKIWWPSCAGICSPTETYGSGSTTRLKPHRLAPSLSSWSCPR